MFQVQAKGILEKEFLSLKDGDKNKSVETVNTVTSNGKEFESILVLTLNIRFTSEWILDSGCSYHMCQDKSLFYTLKEVQGGKVFMGNDQTC